MEVSQLMPEMPSQQIELSGMRTAFAPQDSMAAKRLELDGQRRYPSLPSQHRHRVTEAGRPCAHAYSVPE